MQAIKKYPLELNPKGVQSIEIPVTGEVLSVQFHKGVLCLWALIDLDAPTQPRFIFLVRTDFKFDTARMRYVGTCQIPETEAAVHVFEQKIPAYSSAELSQWVTDTLLDLVWEKRNQNKE